MNSQGILAALLALVLGNAAHAVQYDRPLHRSRTFFTWIEHAPPTLKFSATMGLIYQNRGSAKLELYAAADAEMKSNAQAEVAPDKQEHAVELASTFNGLHHIEVTDHGAGTRLTWPAGTPLTVAWSFEQRPVFSSGWTLCFYVPRGTKTIGGYSKNSGVLRNPSGEVAHTFDKKPGFFSVPVGAGEDGKLWDLQP